MYSEHFDGGAPVLAGPLELFDVVQSRVDPYKQAQCARHGVFKLRNRS